MTDSPICECGHAWKDHNRWWDIGDAESNGGPSCGMGCDLCDCDDPTVDGERVPRLRQQIVRPVPVVTEREPLRIPCEGSGCPPAGSTLTDRMMQLNGMCAMCGRVRMLDDDGNVVGHDREDVLAMLDRGDYG